MFGLADITTVWVIEDGLRNLAANRDHCLYIFGYFNQFPNSSYVNKDYINQAVDLITKNAIHVAPYYEMDIKRRPSVAVVSSGAESQQYLGDYGMMETMDVTFPPIVYCEFDAKSYSPDGTSLFISSQVVTEGKLWPNAIVTNGQSFARIKGINKRDGQDTELVLDGAVQGPYKGWRSQSLIRQKGAEILSSMDSVTVQIQLLTTGSASVHRLLALAIRYCLKRGRQIFEQYGVQTPTFSYTPMMITDDTELEYQTTFTVEAKVSDSWIHREFNLPDDTKEVVLHPVIAVPTDPKDDEVTLA